MRRTIVEPADVTGAALGDLKSWLGITRPNEDDQLLDLLHSALSTCEAFTGQAPLAQIVEERVPVHRTKTLLNSRPVATFVAAEAIGQDGNRNPVDQESYDFELQSDSRASFNLHHDVEGKAIGVQLRAGIAENWSDVPGPLKQGMIRLCAFHYRERDRAGETKSAPVPPASISALWRPWRSVRIA